MRQPPPHADGGPSGHSSTIIDLAAEPLDDSTAPIKHFAMRGLTLDVPLPPGKWRLLATGKGVWIEGAVVRAEPAAAGAVAGGLTLLKNEPVGSSLPPRTAAYVRLAGSSPAPGSTISVGHGSLVMTFDVYGPQNLPAGGEITVSLHPGSVDSSRACVRLGGSYGGELPAFTLRQVSVASPFRSVDPACGSSFQVTRARVSFVAFGSGYFQTSSTVGAAGGATGLVDIAVDYRFEP